MELFIKQEIKQSATLCKKEHICLKRQKECLCQVISTVNDDRLYVYCVSNMNGCNYKHKTDERILCTCPVRLEIYNKYKI